VIRLDKELKGVKDSASIIKEDQNRFEFHNDLNNKEIFQTKNQYDFLKKEHEGLNKQCIYLQDQVKMLTSEMNLKQRELIELKKNY